MISLADWEESLITDADRTWLHHQHQQEPQPEPGSAHAQPEPTPATTQPPAETATASATPTDGPTAADSRFETTKPTPPTEDGGRFARLGVLPGDRCVCGGRIPAQPTGTITLTVRLTTLAGLDDHPALLGGLSTIPAYVARHLATRKTTWAWSLRDPRTGRLLHHGTTTHRPTNLADNDSVSDATTATVEPEPGAGTASTGTASTGTANSRFETTKTQEHAADDRVCTCPRVAISPHRDVIDLQLTPADLRHPPHGWEQVVADIASQVAKQPPPQRWRQRDTEGRLKDHGYTSRSFPAEEAAFIRARDVTCQTPGCQRPAKTCDLDHVVEHAKGGPSHRGNGQARCARHHHLRDLPGVTITMADDGTTTITLPNGTTYTLPPDQNLNLIHDGETHEDDGVEGNDSGNGAEGDGDEDSDGGEGDGAQSSEAEHDKQP